MVAFLILVLHVVVSPLKTKARLEAEIIVLRHQLNVLRRRVPSKPRLAVADRFLFVWLYRLFPSVLNAIAVVQPETIIRWHRKGFGLYWRWKSRGRGGRPKVPVEIRGLIRSVSWSHSRQSPSTWRRVGEGGRRPGVGAIAEYYAQIDVAALALVQGKTTWGEYTQVTATANREMNAKTAQVSSDLQRGLAQSHQAELSRRQQAAASLSNYVYQQQVLLQNQQMINAMNQPRMTNCQYVGAYLNCATF
jgi:hypothetical protein